VRPQRGARLHRTTARGPNNRVVQSATPCEKRVTGLRWSFQRAEFGCGQEPLLGKRSRLRSWKGCLLHHSYPFPLSRPLSGKLHCDERNMTDIHCLKSDTGRFTFETRGGEEQRGSGEEMDGPQAHSHRRTATHGERSYTLGAQPSKCIVIINLLGLAPAGPWLHRTAALRATYRGRAAKDPR
jgi:hypothetical protein